MGRHRGHFIDTQILSTTLDYAMHHVIRSKTKGYSENLQFYPVNSPDFKVE